MRYLILGLFILIIACNVKKNGKNVAGIDSLKSKEDYPSEFLSKDWKNVTIMQNGQCIAFTTTILVILQKTPG